MLIHTTSNRNSCLTYPQDTVTTLELIKVICARFFHVASLAIPWFLKHVSRAPVPISNSDLRSHLDALRTRDRPVQFRPLVSFSASGPGASSAACRSSSMDWSISMRSLERLSGGEGMRGHAILQGWIEHVRCNCLCFCANMILLVHAALHMGILVWFEWFCINSLSSLRTWPIAFNDQVELSIRVRLHKFHCVVCASSLFLGANKKHII